MRTRDNYTKRAVQEGYRARSSFKLKQINQKYDIIRRGSSVLDLGCWPGGWLIAAKEFSKSGVVIGIDLDVIKPIDGVNFIQGDVTSKSIQKQLLAFGKFDVVLSDMAPKTSGIHSLDVSRSVELAGTALGVAEKMLKPGGSFLCKVFQGEGFDDFMRTVRKKFEFSKSVKPDASRKESREMYVLAKGFKDS